MCTTVEQKKGTFRILSRKTASHSPPPGGRPQLVFPAPSTPGHFDGFVADPLPREVGGGEVGRGSKPGQNQSVTEHSGPPHWGRPVTKWLCDKGPGPHTSSSSSCRICSRREAMAASSCGRGGGGRPGTPRASELGWPPGPLRGGPVACIAWPPQAGCNLLHACGERGEAYVGVLCLLPRARGHRKHACVEAGAGALTPGKMLS